MSRPPLAGREAYAYWIEVQTRWADNDIYGHVNNTVHYQWFDLIVNRWLIEAGLLNLAGGDAIGLVVETGCRYAKPLSFPETVDVGLSVRKLGTSSCTYGIGIFADGDDEASAEGTFTHVYVNAESRRPISIPENWRNEIQRLANIRP
jgi:acyl-CoA thioester hydrolase